MKRITSNLHGEGNISRGNGRFGNKTIGRSDAARDATLAQSQIPGADAVDAVSSMSRRAADWSRSGVESIARSGRNLRKTYNGSVAAARGFVKEQPMKAALIASGIGATLMAIAIYALKARR